MLHDLAVRLTLASGTVSHLPSRDGFAVFEFHGAGVVSRWRDSARLNVMRNGPGRPTEAVAPSRTRKWRRDMRF